MKGVNVRGMGRGYILYRGNEGWFQSIQLDAVAESVERSIQLRKDGSWNPNQVKPMITKLSMSLPSQVDTIIRIGQGLSVRIT